MTTDESPRFVAIAPPDENLPYVLAYLRFKSLRRVARELCSSKDVVRRRVQAWVDAQSDSANLPRVAIFGDGDTKRTNDVSDVVDSG